VSNITVSLQQVQAESINIISQDCGNVIPSHNASTGSANPAIAWIMSQAGIALAILIVLVIFGGFILWFSLKSRQSDELERQESLVKQIQALRTTQRTNRLPERQTS
jgi:nitrogen fixation-related uncharacterized protein